MEEKVLEVDILERAPGLLLGPFWGEVSLGKGPYAFRILRLVLLLMKNMAIRPNGSRRLSLLRKNYFLSASDNIFPGSRRNMGKRRKHLRRSKEEVKDTPDDREPTSPFSETR